jgi:hypothetical protein
MFCVHVTYQGGFGKLTKTRRAIQGYGGVEVYDVYKGTLKWKIEDDKGRHHTIYIPESYYVPKSDARLISPQHWAQQVTRKDRIWTKHADPDGTFCGHFMTERH